MSLEHNSNKILELIKYGEFVKYLSDFSFCSLKLVSVLLVSQAPVWLHP